MKTRDTGHFLNYSMISASLRLSFQGFFFMKNLSVILSAIASMALVLVPPAKASVATIIAFDNFNDFNRALNLEFYTPDPDLDGSSGIFPGSGADADVFGVTNRPALVAAGNNPMVDTSLADGGLDTLGILQTTKTDGVFGIQDLDNGDNPNAPNGTVEWVFNVSGYTNLSISIDFAAMGDFDADNDILSFTAQVGADPPVGVVPETVFAFSVLEGGLQSYTLEFGNVVNLDDPLQVNGVTLSNQFQTLTSPVSGTGEFLTLTLDAQQDSSSEAIVFDNITIMGEMIPEPSSALLVMLTVLGFAAPRRRS